MKRAMNNKKGFTLFKNQRFSNGFTMIEIAIVMIIIGAFISFGVGMVGTLFKGNRFKQTKVTVKNAKDALMGYALKNNRFPCPDTDGDGVEDCSYTPSSPFKDTRLPYVTINIKGKDSYMNQLYYDVNDETVNSKTLTSTSMTGYDFCTILKNITGYPRITQNAGSSYSSAAAIVLSSSENRSLDISINSTDTRDFETKGITDDFDDIVDWINPNTLLAELGCQADCSSYTVYNRTASSVYVYGGIYSSCNGRLLVNGDMFNVRSGDTVKVYSGANCTTLRETVTYTTCQTEDIDEDCSVQVDTSFALDDE